MRTSDQYPICLSQDQHRDVDLHDLHERLVMASPRIFSGQGDIEMWRRSENNEETPAQSIFDPDSVECTRRDVIYFIHQATSWSPLQTSADNLKRLLAAHTVFPAFLDALFSFGAKVTGDDDPYFNLCYQCESDTSFEICYILRTYEKHNRPTLKNAWSLRQMSVYHKYHRATATSVWIFIQPFKRCKQALWREFPRARSFAQNIHLHSLLIGLTLHDWRWYLDSRRQFINQFTEKASHSSLCPKPHDYNTGFNDVQSLQSAKDSLLLARNILQSVLQIILMIQKQPTATYFNSIPEPGTVSTNPPPQNTLSIGTDQQLIPKIQGYLRTAETLQKVAAGTSELLSKLLEYRNADISSDLTQTLTTLSAQGNAQTGHLRSLAEESRADSRSMSVLTVIGTIHIPANLIASIFSSGLVQFPNRADAADIRLLSVQTSMWVYVASSLMLSGITILGAYLWMRHSSRFGRAGRMLSTRG
ncbi:hypothetical protein BDZ45DRAFT_729630 [Acephala macrosclerotiorum]|nr:hypothetical protein BDZ45DRAFT_729630 [Acephala macrosclerotiorum]